MWIGVYIFIGRFLKYDGARAVLHDKVAAAVFLMAPGVSSNSEFLNRRKIAVGISIFIF